MGGRVGGRNGRCEVNAVWIFPSVYVVAARVSTSRSSVAELRLSMNQDDRSPSPITPCEHVFFAARRGPYHRRHVSGSKKRGKRQRGFTHRLRQTRSRANVFFSPSSMKYFYHPRLRVFGFFLRVLPDLFVSSVPRFHDNGIHTPKQTAKCLNDFGLPTGSSNSLPPTSNVSLDVASM